MKKKINLVIDLGTNTAIFSVIESVENQLIITYEKSITTRIGKNLSKTSLISPNILKKNIELLSSELNYIYKENKIDKTYAITTEWVRKAENGAECLKQLEEKLKISFELIQGEEEALYTMEAIKHIAENKNFDNFGVCDIGGGSTEFCFFNKKTTNQSMPKLYLKSLPLGVVLLEEDFCLSKNMDNAKKALAKINGLLDKINSSHKNIFPDVLFVSGGTATTIGTMIMGIKDYDPVPIEGFELNEEKLNTLLEKLQNLSLEDIKTILSSDPKRSDLITTGTLLLKTIIQKLNPKKIFVTTLGPRHGYLINKLGIKNIKDIKYKLK
jgi:exopolyphosphatase / guanosine-5'-triphosphate,3'-diphosphate pyrophosphatase